MPLYGLGASGSWPDEMGGDALRPETPYGYRREGTPKHAGYFGELKRPGGGVSTELSIGVDGEEIPSLVPTLSPREVARLLRGGAPTRAIVGKAADHAEARRQGGQPAFAATGLGGEFGGRGASAAWR